MPNRRKTTLPILLAVAACLVGLLAVAGDSQPEAQGARRPEAPQPNPVEPLTAAEKELMRLWRAGVDGSNEVLLVVDGEPITVESIRSELEGTIETQISTELLVAPMLNRQQAEARVIVKAVRSKASSLILRRTARETGLPVSEAQVSSQIDTLKDWRGIARDDLAAWAEYTMDNFGKTPLRFREALREEVAEFTALQAMSGQLGVIRGLELPIFLPLETSPADLREDYQKAKAQWRKITDIDYTLIAVGIQGTASIGTRQLVDGILSSAAVRLRNETVDAVGSYVRQELERIRDVNPVIRIEPNVLVAGDEDFDDFGRAVRGLKLGDVSLPQENSIDGVSWRYFVRLNSATEGVSRDFSDPVVQRQLTRMISERRIFLNQAKVREALLDRAIVVPASLLGR